VPSRALVRVPSRQPERRRAVGPGAREARPGVEREAAPFPAAAESLSAGSNGRCWPSEKARQPDAKPTRGPPSPRSSPGSDACTPIYAPLAQRVKPKSTRRRLNRAVASGIAGEGRPRGLAGESTPIHSASDRLNGQA
jgi:hypothetical protein